MTQNTYAMTSEQVLRLAECVVTTTALRSETPTHNFRRIRCASKGQYTSDCRAFQISVNLHCVLPVTAAMSPKASNAGHETPTLLTHRFDFVRQKLK
jgi:hypothetical protein